MLQEAASGEHVSKLQEELEQLRTNFGQMKVHLQAAQQSQTDAQVLPSCLDTVSILATRLGLLHSFLSIPLFSVALLFLADDRFIPSLCFASSSLCSLPCYLPAVH